MNGFLREQVMRQVVFCQATGIGTRNELQFVAHDWMNRARRWRDSGGRPVIGAQRPRAHSGQRPAIRQPRDVAQALQGVDLAAAIRKGALQAEDATQAARRAARGLERALGTDDRPVRWSTVSRAGGLSTTTTTTEETP